MDCGRIAFASEPTYSVGRGCSTRLGGWSGRSPEIRRVDLADAAEPYINKGSINFISGAAADDAWATGPAARDVYHWDGAQWTQPGAASGAPYILNIGTPIWPAGGERAWAGGCADHVHASLFLWDGSRWSRIDTAVAGCVHAIAGTSPSDVWATAVEYVHGGGSFPTPASHSLHWDGARWSEVPALPGSFFSPARGEVWVVSGGGSTDGYVYARADGGHFHDFLWLPNIGYTTAMAAAGTADVFIVGEGGLLAHSDGKMIRRFTGPNAGIGSLWAGSGGHAWATVGGSLIRRDNGCWSNVDVGKAAYDQSTGVGPLRMWQLSGSGPDDVWATAGTFAVHWDGETFSQHVIPGGGLTGVWVGEEKVAAIVLRDLGPAHGRQLQGGDEKGSEKRRHVVTEFSLGQVHQQHLVFAHGGGQADGFRYGV